MGHRRRMTQRTPRHGTTRDGRLAKDASYGCRSFLCSGTSAKGGFHRHWKAMMLGADDAHPAPPFILGVVLRPHQHLQHLSLPKFRSLRKHAPIHHCRAWTRCDCRSERVQFCPDCEWLFQFVQDAYSIAADELIPRPSRQGRELGQRGPLVSHCGSPSNEDCSYKRRGSRRHRRLRIPTILRQRVTVRGPLPCCLDATMWSFTDCKASRRLIAESTSHEASSESQRQMAAWTRSLVGCS